MSPPFRFLVIADFRCCLVGTEKKVGFQVVPYTKFSMKHLKRVESSEFRWVKGVNNWTMENIAYTFILPDKIIKQRSFEIITSKSYLNLIVKIKGLIMG